MGRQNDSTLMPQIYLENNQVLLEFKFHDRVYLEIQLKR